MSISYNYDQVNGVNPNQIYTTNPLMFTTFTPTQTFALQSTAISPIQNSEKSESITSPYGILKQSSMAENSVQSFSIRPTGYSSLSGVEEKIKGLNPEILIQQFVLLCTENERLSYAYLIKDREVTTITNELFKLKSLKAQTSVPSKSDQDFARQLEIEDKLKIFQSRIETLTQQKIELQQKEYGYLQRIEELQRINPSESKNSSELAQSHLEISKLNLELGELRERLNRQISITTSNLHNSNLLAEKDLILLSKNKEISELRNYITALEKDVEVIQQKFKQSESRNHSISLNENHDISNKIVENRILEIRSELDVSQLQLAKTSANLELILAENSKLSQALSSRIDENEMLKQMSLSAAKQVTNLAAENKQLKENLENQINNVSGIAVHKELNELMEEFESLKKSLSSKDKSISELNRKAEELEMEQNSHLKTQQNLRIIQIRSAELERQISSLSDECASLRQKNNQIEVSYEEQIKEIKDRFQIQVMEGYEQELIALKARAEQSESQKDSVMGKLASFEHKITINDQQLKEFKLKMQQAEEECESIAKDRLDKREKLEALEKQFFFMSEKHLLIRIENERLHGVLNRLQRENDDLKNQLQSNTLIGKRQTTEVINKIQELEEINRSSKQLIGDQATEIARLEKQNATFKHINVKKDECDNNILYLNRELDTLKLKLIESESIRKDLRQKCQDYTNTLLNYQQVDLQLAFLTKENERLQKLIMERCRQTTTLW